MRHLLCRVGSSNGDHRRALVHPLLMLAVCIYFGATVYVVEASRAGARAGASHDADGAAARLLLGNPSSGSWDSAQPGWAVQKEPTESAPFVFLHQRKAGGTSWRRLILFRALETSLGRRTPTTGMKADLPASLSRNKSDVTVKSKRKGGRVGSLEPSMVIPCVTHDCSTYALPAGVATYSVSHNPPPFVVAGHIPWSEYTGPLGRSGRRYFSQNARVLTGFRHPVQQTLSCMIHFIGRWYPSLDAIALSSRRKLRRILLDRGYHTAGFGCLNEPIRMLSGYSDEWTINRLGLPENAALARGLVEQTKRNLASRFVVSILERPEESRAVVEHHFPWLVPAELPHVNSEASRRAKRAADAQPPAAASSPTDDKNKDNLPTAGAPSQLPDDILDMLAELNAPSIELYEFATQLLMDRFRNISASSKESV